MMEENKKKQSQLQAMWFAAGTAAFMACLQRAVLVSFVEQWRVVMFLSLNLLLLAILFTSPPPPSPSPTSSDETTCQQLNEDIEFKVEGKQGRKKCGSTTTASMLLASATEDHPDAEDVASDHLKLRKCRSKREDQDAAGNVKDSTMNNQAYELSKEELNERVEAFIVMFRQHLVSDAKGKKCRFHSPSNKRRAVCNTNCGRIGKVL